MNGFALSRLRTMIEQWGQRATTQIRHVSDRESTKESMRQPQLWQRLSSPSAVLLLPTILIILFLSIFPLIVSLFLSFTRVTFVRGGVDVAFVGLSNYQKLLFGSQQRHFLGRFSELSPIGWLICISVTGAMLYWLYQSLVTPGGRSRDIFPLGWCTHNLAASMGLHQYAHRGWPAWHNVVTLILLSEACFFNIASASYWRCFSFRTCEASDFSVSCFYCQ